MTDRELLSAHVTGASLEAFGELVRRHLPLVLSTARRRLSIPDHAEDVSQQVFTVLARKAPELGRDVILSGWLYRTAVHLAGEHNRSEGRRQRREQEAVTAMNDPHPDTTWKAIEPLLDDAMARLPERDRDAVVLRYFENRSLGEVGRTLGISEDAAQKRLSRSIDRLRQFIHPRQPWITPGALAAAITAGAIESAPSTAHAAAIATAALAAATVGSTSLTTSTFTLLTMTTTKTLISGAIGIALVTGLVLQHQQVRSLQAEQERLQAVAAEAAAAAAIPAPVAAPNPGADPELLRLRGEVARLRGQSNELARLKSEVNKLRATRTGPTPQNDDANTEERRRVAIAKMVYAKGWSLAIHLYASKHDGQVPMSFADAASEFPKDAESPDLDPSQYELMYSGSLAAITEPARVILAREKEAYVVRSAQGFDRTYAFADGHSEIHHSQDGNFEPWERQHLAKPPGQ